MSTDKSEQFIHECDCYVLPHTEDCSIFVGVTQSGERVEERRSGMDRRSSLSHVAPYGPHRTISEGYQDVFNAIAAAVKTEAGGISISVEKFLANIPTVAASSSGEQSGETSEERRLRHRLEKIDRVLDELGAPKSEPVEGLTMELSRVGRIRRLVASASGKQSDG